MNNWFHHFHRVFRLCLSLALAAVLTTLTWATLAHAQHPGDLDPTFNGTGIVTTSITGGQDGGFGVALQPDGKIVVSGFNNNLDLAIIRYTITGSLDTAFNHTGVVTTPLIKSPLGPLPALQPDGKIVGTGMGCFGGGYPGVDYCYAVARYTITGSLDTTFNNTGIVTTPVGNSSGGFAIAIQPTDSKIIVSGWSDDNIAIVRYTITGSLDTDFNYAGIVTTAMGSSSAGGQVVLQPDGKILVSARSDDNFAVVRYTITGSLDTEFNGTGIVTTSLNRPSRGYSIALQPDGRIVVAGGYHWLSVADGDFVVIRYNSDGSLDTTFNHTGIVTTSITPISDDGYSVAIQPDGKIVVAGVSGMNVGQGGDFAVVRYNNNGSLDTNFNHTGIVTTSITPNVDFGASVALQPNDGKIVVAGQSCLSGYSACNFAVARYIGQGGTYYLPVIFKG